MNEQEQGKSGTGKLLHSPPAVGVAVHEEDKGLWLQLFGGDSKKFEKPAKIIVPIILELYATLFRGVGY